MAEVVLADVTLTRAGGARALRDLTLRAGDGELLALVGPSGCGKTSSLRLVAGLERPTAGRVWIGGRDVTDLPTRERDVAFVFQDHSLLPHLDVAGNLAFGLRLRRLPEPEVRDRVLAEARVLRLQRLLSRRPAQLSAGQRQSVALGRTTARRAGVFLLDEPLARLDAHERARLRREIVTLLKGMGVTALYATNDQLEAMAVGDRVAVLCAGALQQAGRPQALYDRPANLFVAAFLGTPPMSLLAGVLQADGDRVTLWLGGRPLSAGPLPAMGPVIVGLRPEALRLQAGPRHPRADDGLPAEVAELERHGDHTLVRCLTAAPGVTVTGADADLCWSTRPGGRLALRLPAHAGVRPGDALTVAVDGARLHLFDLERGTAVWHPPA